MNSVFPDIFRFFESVTGFNREIQLDILYSFLAVFGLWIFRLYLLRIVWKKNSDPGLRYRWQKISGYITFALGFLFLFRIWISGLESLSTIIGLLTAGLAIALQDFVKSIAGWMYLLWRKPFDVGDRIEIGKYTGDVIDMRLFKFTLLEIGNWVQSDQSTGRILHLPNSMILDQAIANYTSGFEFIWDEIGVLLTFESDWEKAKMILSDIVVKFTRLQSEQAEHKVREASKKYMIFYNRLTPIVYTSVKDSGVMLSVRYIVEPRLRRMLQEEIWEEILRRFKREKSIDFAYPTTRFYNNKTEGKSFGSE